jgi:ABC-type branched-subunit amino acid transport system substrate-binding protein
VITGDEEQLMSTIIDRPARVGVVTDQTGPLSFMGLANVNVATMVVDDINARGGVLGHPVELFIEDSGTDDDIARVAAQRLVDADVDVVIGGIYSSTRQAIKDPVVDQAGLLYLYPEQYEGQECHPLIFCTGPVPAQQVEPLMPWLMDRTGATRFYLPSADYIWPHTMNKKVREVVSARGGEIVGEEYFPLDHTDYAAVVADIMASGAEVVFNTIVPPGLTPFLARLYEAGFQANGGIVVCTYFDENFLNLVPAAHVEGLYGCLDYYRDVHDPFSIDLLNRYEARYPGSAMFTAGSACSGTYRALKLWEAAVNEAGSLRQHDVVAALDHARITQGPGGPAEMVPGQHHVRMNMYIARSEGGTFRVVENLGHIDPQESVVR